MSQPDTLHCLFLARHGETEWNRIKRLQGYLNSPLTSLGVEQAESLAKRVAAVSIGQVVSSPIGRAYATAKLCGLHLQQRVILDYQLVERDFGDWQGALWQDLASNPSFTSVFHQVNHVAAPQGETGIACGQRMMSALCAIAERQIEIGRAEHASLIISHGDAIRCLLSLLGADKGLDAYSSAGNASMVKLIFRTANKQLLLAAADPSH